MQCLPLRALRLGGLVVLLILLGAGVVNTSRSVQAAGPADGELFLLLYPENDDLPYACVGKPVKGFIITGIEKEPSDSDPLASLVPPEIEVKASDPKVGTLSQNSWTVKPGGEKRWTYTPTKAGTEDLLFTASIPNSAYKPITRKTHLPVLNCQYELTITSEANNSQGGIQTYISYTAKGHFDLVPQKNFPWIIRGYGETHVLAVTKGAEGSVSCDTVEPAEGRGAVLVRGQASDATDITLNLYFDNAGSGLGMSCIKDGKRRPGYIPFIGWLPSGKAEGTLEDLKFAVAGDSVQLGIGEFNDRRWTRGGNSGLMIIEVTPVKGK